MIAVAVVLLLEHGQAGSCHADLGGARPLRRQPALSGLAMSESSNLAGGKVTYLDGHIANKGNRTVTGITVQVLFRDSAQEVTQNETQPLKLIRTRDPYVDLEPVSAAPASARRRTRLPADLRRRVTRLGRSLSRDSHHPCRFQIIHESPRTLPGRTYFEL